MSRLTNYSFRGRSLVREVFVETGTYHGETARFAHDAGFPEVLSIEFADRNARQAATNLNGIPGIKLYSGSSPKVLPQIIDPKKASTFWLDAHYQGGSDDELDPNYGQCPLLDELRAIVAVEWQSLPFILIDDAHLFTQPVRGPFDSAAWPTLAEIQIILGDQFACEIENDVIYCLPSEPATA